jgi:hypothetical protein
MRDECTHLAAGDAVLVEHAEAGEAGEAWVVVGAKREAVVRVEPVVVVVMASLLRPPDLDPLGEAAAAHCDVGSLLRCACCGLGLVLSAGCLNEERKCFILFFVLPPPLQSSTIFCSVLRAEEVEHR